MGGMKCKCKKWVKVVSLLLTVDSGFPSMDINGTHGEIF